MPVVLSQHFSPNDRIYEDAEGSVYHYPRQYFSRIRPYDSFVYYRPLGKSQPRPDSKYYFGYGMLGLPYTDPNRQDHRFVDLIRYQPFRNLVPLRDPLGNYYETGTPTQLPTQAAVRQIGELDFLRILAAAGVAQVGISQMPNTEEIVASAYHGPPIAMPTDDLREISAIPGGTGYKPNTDHVIDAYESAALQERARADHQGVLSLILNRVHRVSGQCWYNNNIDLFVRVGDSQYLVEAKSLVNPSRAVDRMRYGIGQLADYDARYQSKVGPFSKVLAFGRPPDRDTSWVATVLDRVDVAFIAAERGNIVPLNDHARSIDLFR